MEGTNYKCIKIILTELYPLLVDTVLGRIPQC